MTVAGCGIEDGSVSIGMADLDMALDGLTPGNTLFGNRHPVGGCAVRAGVLAEAWLSRQLHVGALTPRVTVSVGNPVVAIASGNANVRLQSASRVTLEAR